MARIDGRITAEAVARCAEAMAGALDSSEPFAVVLDRTSMSAFTDEGREALHTWWERVSPALEQWCVAWADVYDPRRARALADHDHTSRHPYPQVVFASLPEAEDWARAALTHHAATAGRS